MNSWKVILATLVIFGAGVITGGLLVTYSESVLRHPNNKPGDKHQQPQPGVWRDNLPLIPPNVLLRRDFVERLDRELKLTAEQREHIEKIVSEGQEHMKELSQRIEPQARVQLATTRERIRSELTAEQQVQFTELLKRRPGPARGTNAPAPVIPTNSPATDAPPAKP